MTAFESPSLGLASVLPSHPWQSLFAGIRWSRLFFGIACTVLAGLSVHVVMQQVFRVPFPSNYPAHAWPVHIDHAAIVFGLLLMLSWTEATVDKQGFLSRWLVLFIVYSMLRETSVAVLWRA